MGSINPFAKYILAEIEEDLKSGLGKERGEEDKQYWLLEESIFQKPPGQPVNPATLKKTSA
jgi:hypothetical protein